MAYSATTVFPLPVGAATSTDWPSSRASSARSWKSSSGKSKWAVNSARRAFTQPIVSGGGRLGAALATLGNQADDDGDGVEDHHRNRQRHHRVWIAAGCDHRSEHEDDHGCVAPLLDQRLRCEDPDELQEHQKHRELERDSEGSDHQADQADVLADLEVGLDVGACPADQELD